MIVISNKIVKGVLIPDLVVAITQYGSTSELTIDTFDSDLYSDFLNLAPIAIINDGSGNWAEVSIMSTGVTFEAQFFIQNVFIAFQKYNVWFIQNTY